MPRTNLSTLRVRIAEVGAGQDPDVQIAYSFTTTDGDTLSKTRDGVFDNLGPAQRVAITDLLASLRQRITNLENIG